MTGAPGPRDALAAFFRQRAEMGVKAWPLETMTRNEALALAARAGVRTAARSTGPDASREAGARTAPETVLRHGPKAGGGLPSVPRAGQGTAATGSGGAADPGSDGGNDSFEPPASYSDLRTAALACTRCRLAGERTQVVFSDGNPEARVMVVGEAPGANEDRTGVPFVGAAGKLLDLLLANVGLSRRDSVYICNVLKCRPPGNRNPRPDEIESCAPWLHRQIELVEPEVILAVGTFAGKLLTGRDMALSRLRGEVYSYRGTPLVVTYHPAALLRNSGWTRATWNDLQLLRQVLDES